MATRLTPPAREAVPLDATHSAMEMNWPNFFVVGACKAGTTSLHAHLNSHPQIFLPRDNKEPGYFSPEFRSSGKPSLDLYRALYADANGYTAIGDMSTRYLPSAEAAGRISQVSPAAKIVIILRDPVERAYSHYMFNRDLFYRDSQLETCGSFHEALRRYDDRSAEGWWLSQEYIEFGLYYSQVRRYVDTFGRDRVLVLLFDDLKQNPNGLLARIAQHIGVDPGFFVGRDYTEIHNPYRVPKYRIISWIGSFKVARRIPHSLKAALRPYLHHMQKPPLDDDSRRWLQELYDPDITQLEELLGRKVPELRQSWI